MGFIMGIRRIRGEMNIKPSKRLPVLLQNGNEQDAANLENNRHYLDTLARLESITWLTADQDAPESATALVGEMKVLIPMAGLIDKEAELSRLDKELAKRQKELERITGKLSNASFVDKAPAAVVEKEQKKADDLTTAIAQLQSQLAKIKSL